MYATSRGFTSGFSFCIVVVIIFTLMTSGGGSVVTQTACPAGSYNRILQFKKAGTPGDRSYITEPDSPLAVPDPRDVVGATKMPMIIVELRSPPTVTVGNITGPSTTESGPLDYGLDGTGLTLIVSAVAPQELTISSNRKTFAQGIITFTELKVTEFPENSTIPSRLKFALYEGNESLALAAGYEDLVLETGLITWTSQVDKQASNVTFANRGFFYYQGQRRVVAAAPVVIPDFTLVAYDLLGVEFSSINAEVSVSVDVGTITSTLAKTFPSSGGSLVWEGLTYVAPTNLPVGTASVTATLTFSTLYLPNGYPQVIEPATCKITVEFEPQLGRHIRFEDAVTNYLQVDNDGLDKTAVLNYVMPATTLQLLTSWYDVDTTITGVLITATCEQAELEGNVVVVQDGVAVFRDLVFTTQSLTAVITFTADPDCGYPVAGSQVYSGLIVVESSASLGKHLSFAASSFVQADGKTRYVKRTGSNTFDIPSVVVQMRDSAFRIDSTADDIDIHLVVGSIVSTTMSSGIAAFSNVELESRNEEITVVVNSEFLTLSSTPIVVVLDTLTDVVAGYQNCLTAESFAAALSAEQCPFALQFADASFSVVFEEGQTLYTSVGAAIGEIRVQVIDIFGETRSVTGESASLMPVLLAYTEDDPATETLLVTDNLANEGTWRGTEFIFACLSFREQPTSLPTIKFRLVDRATRSIPLYGIHEIATGLVTVTSSNVLGYGIRFGAEGSLLTYTGQVSSAVKNIVLPPIVIEVEDSAHDFDSTAQDVLIVATASSGQLATDGSQELVVDGKATFSNIMFSLIEDEAYITFTALQTTPILTGRSVSSGVFTLTQQPIENFEIAFSDTYSDENNVTINFQPFVYATVDATRENPVLASIIIRNSAHQREQIIVPGGDGQVLPVTIALTCDEAFLFTQPEQTISAEGIEDASANFSTGLLSYKTGYDGASVYFKYTVQASDLTTQGNPHLVGKTIVVGPIRTIESSGTQTCAQALESPLVVVEFELGMTAFTDNVDDAILPPLAYSMGVASDRVLMSNLRVADGIYPNDPTSRWSGVKVDVTFTDPSATSTNRKSSAVLAAEFVALRSTCSQNVPGLLNIYYKSQELICDIDAFEAGKKATITCIEDAYIPLCHCYTRHIFQPLGAGCTYNDTLNAELNSLCDSLTACGDAYIQDVCSVVLSQNAVTYYWLYASGSVIVVGLIGTFFAWQRQLLCWKPRTTYNDISNQHRRKR